MPASWGHHLDTYFYVGIGGFLGANARYILSGWITRLVVEHLRLTLPLGTLFVNVSGSFLLALFAVWAGSHLSLPHSLRLLIATGFFGAYTTFSTYANESIELIRGGNWLLGIGNIVLSNGLCLIGVVLGILLGQRLWPPA